jgi:hypothetical protein
VTTGSSCFWEYIDTALLVVHLEFIRSWARSAVSDFRMNSNQTIFALSKRKRDDHVLQRSIPSFSLVAPGALNGFLIFIEEVCDD